MIVGLGYMARVGKDTVADILVKEYGFTKVGFADKLRELAERADPIVGEANGKPISYKQAILAVGYEEAKNRFTEFRPFLQHLGQGARDTFGEDFWVKMALEEAANHDQVVISDMRYRNEADAIRAEGGIAVHIDRPGVFVGDHVSERGLADYKDFDWEIHNGGTLDELRRKVELLMDFWSARL